MDNVQASHHNAYISTLEQHGDEVISLASQVGRRVRMLIEEHCSQGKNM
jgi:hypothetical protein